VSSFLHFPFSNKPVVLLGEDGRMSDKPQLDAKPPLRPAGSLQFVQVSHPGHASSWRRVVRSHAARNAHAKARRVRILDHQRSLDHLDQEERDGRLVLAPKGILGAGRTDPFDSFARRLTPMEGFLLDHCKRVLGNDRSLVYPRIYKTGEIKTVCGGYCSATWANHLSHAVVRYVTVNATVCDHFEDASLFRHGMGTHWVQLAATDAGMLSAVFLSACRSLDGLGRGEAYVRASLAYKGDCIRSVNTAISREGRSVSDVTIAKSLALASEAVSLSLFIPLWRVATMHLTC
jgi:hypothetical protein